MTKKEIVEYVKHIQARLYHSVSNVNHYAHIGDSVKNKIAYGEAITLAWNMQDWGHEIGLPVWEDDNGNIRIPEIIIDGDRWVEFWDGIPHELPIDILIG
ncbi:MAG: hypothetical protein V3G42_14860 [Oscillospiraceae bacterium]